MEQLAPITLRKGATTVVQIDLSTFEMQGSYVALTVAENKKKEAKIIASFVMDEQRVWDLTFKDEDTEKLDLKENAYVYDIMWHLNDERFAQCAPSPVIVEATAGGYPHDPDADE